MITVEENIENMFKEIAKSLKMAYRKTIIGRTESYEIINQGEIQVAFIAFLNPGVGTITFASKTFHPKSFGPYKLEDLKTKAKNEILVKLAESMQKK